MLKPTAEKIKDELQSRGLQPVFVSLVGSQCKGLANEDSDYDYKAWVIPPLDDIYYCVKRTDHLTLDSYKAEIEIKDVRDLGFTLAKQGSNYLDMLCSPDIWYAPYWDFVLVSGQDFLYMNPRKAYQAAAGMLTKCYGMCKREDKLSWKILIKAMTALDQAKFIENNYFYKTYVSNSTRITKQKQNELDLKEEFEKFKGEVHKFNETYKQNCEDLKPFTAEDNYLDRFNEMIKTKVLYFYRLG